MRHNYISVSISMSVISVNVTMRVIVMHINVIAIMSHNYRHEHHCANQKVQT